MRKLGIFSWFGYDLPLAERLELIAAAGFESTFLWLEPEESLVGRNQADLMPELARRQGLSRSTTYTPHHSDATDSGRAQMLLTFSKLTAILFPLRRCTAFPR